MIAHSLIILTFVKCIAAKYDSNYWVDYETLKFTDDSVKTISNYRNVNNEKYNNFFFNKSISDFDDKIVGGTIADIKNFPYQISIQEKGLGHFCGGSIITRRWIVTAAHCFYGYNTPISSYFIRAGSRFHARDGVIAFPLKIYLAKKYNPATNDYDIALIKLKKGFSKEMFSKYSIRRIYIRKRLPKPGTQLTVTGWGYTTDGGPNLSTGLRKVQIPYMSFSYCNEQTNNAGLITPRQFCAGLTQGGRDSCQGDSGGPITVYKKLVGIVSWGFGCAVPNSPGVYTKISVFLPYIKKLIKIG